MTADIIAGYVAAAPDALVRAEDRTTDEIEELRR